LLQALFPLWRTGGKRRSSKEELYKLDEMNEVN
jgi:hypothetical protein